MVRTLVLIAVIGSAAAISLATFVFAILERRLMIAAAEICFAGLVATIGWAWAARQTKLLPLTGILLLSYVVLATWGRRRARRTCPKSNKLEERQ
jgi:hypothetical protein